jgi:hypothetical protein
MLGGSLGNLSKSVYSFRILAIILAIMTWLTGALKSSVLIFEKRVRRFLSHDIILLPDPFSPRIFPRRVEIQEFVFDLHYIP